MTETASLPADFDAEKYRLGYPDVALSGLSAEVHYLRYGKLLGRVPCPDPDAGAPAAVAPMVATNPALLDLLFAQGVMPQTDPVRHPELVTILMPSHNNEKWLSRAIHSALSQQGVAVEVVVIDDGSTDGSVRLAREIAQNAPNLKVISLLRNFGCYYARNIGLMQSSGAFVTILDTDDIMAPDRIARQLDALKAVPDAVACRCQQRRWTPDYTAPVSALKHGENSLIWRREVMDRIGWYDTVRYSGDAEFRLRLQRRFGTHTVVTIPDELYFTRTVEQSLTLNVASQVFQYDGSKLSVVQSPPRQAYERHFTEWQKKHRKTLTVPFPLLDRGFALGTQAQNASPSLGQRRIGAMASFPARLESLKVVLARVLPQLDELRLYLNDYDAVPDFLQAPQMQAKVKVVLGKDAKGDLRDNGKFHDLPKESAYIFTLDDDLNYPEDYVAQMIHQIEMLGRACVVGVHGVIFPPGGFNQLTQRKVFDFKNGHTGHFVDLLGTGTTAWHSSRFQPSLDEFKSKGQCDLWFAATAAREAVPFFCVPRAKRWLTEHIRHEESLYQEALKEPDAYFETYRASIAPVLKEGRVRKEMTAHLGRCYDSDTLAAAGIAMPVAASRDAPDLVATRRTATHLEPLPTSRRAAPRKNDLHFHIIVNGWNCEEYVTACLRSIAQQLPACYSFEVTLIDDCSTDGTYAALVGTAILPGARVIRVAQNTGPAHARHVGITAIDDPDTIVVLVDMDDALEPHALLTVAEQYRDNPDCLLTIGNWHDQDGIVNPQDFYTDAEIDEQRVRELELFNATHLRTFRRRLYDAVEVSDLLDYEGKWFETCTDVALMYPLMDQCRSNEVVFIHEPIYRYTRKHGKGTLARFGKPHKVARLDFLKSKPSKPKLTR